MLSATWKSDHRTLIGHAHVVSERGLESPFDNFSLNCNKAHQARWLDL